MKKINNLQEAIKICECLEIPVDDEKVLWEGKEIDFWGVSALKRNAWKYIQERVFTALKQMPDTKLEYKRFEQRLEGKDVEGALSILQYTYNAINIDEFNELLEADIWNVPGWSVTMFQVNDKKEQFKYAKLVIEEYKRQFSSTSCTGKKKPISEVIFTERVQRIFVAAIEKGWMKESNNGGYEWLGLSGCKERGYLQQWAYFCGEIFGYRIAGNLPSKELEQAFNLSGLASKLGKVHDSKEQAWRQPINELIKRSTQ